MEIGSFKIYNNGQCIAFKGYSFAGLRGDDFSGPWCKIHEVPFTFCEWI